MSKFLTSLMIPLMLSFSGLVKANDVYTFYIVDYPPYIMAPNNDSTIHGIDIEVVKAAFDSQGVDVTFERLPWKRIIKSMQEGRIAGTVSCSKEKARDDYMLFSAPISYASRVVVSKKSLDTGTIRKITDLSRYSVVAVKGWGMQKELINGGVEHQVAPDLDSALKAVRYRNVDVLYMAEYPALYNVKKLKMQSEIKISPLLDEKSLPLYLCISQQYPNSERLKFEMDNGLRTIKANGLYDSIVSEYLQASDR
ncbi:substrate-binding periplasmic protein [Marinomonas gallaica]|uniref:substrate-binding periplasmic protein n=1 Tax=Marinomonas gallaica TaxID=1806667 RepID=UPI003CE540E6